MEQDEIKDTTQIQVEVSTANELKKLMSVGDTYDTVIKRLLSPVVKKAK